LTSTTITDSDGAAHILDLIETEHVEVVNLRVSDLHGVSRQLSLPVAAVSEEVLVRGLGAGMVYGGYRTVNASDMRMLPDLTTAFLDPVMRPRTLNILCDVAYADGTPFERCPRGILRRAVDRLQSLADQSQLMVSPELEFYIFDDVRYGTEMNTCSYAVDSVEARWNTNREESPNLGYKLQRATSAQITPPRDHLYELRCDIVACLTACGVPVKYHHHELGGAGQSEVEFLFEPAVSTADHLQIGKDIIKTASHKNGKTATFMPKPLFDEAGCGLHFHLSLAAGQHSRFYEEGRYGCLSDLALHSIGGLLLHTPALMALTNPSTNSYRRFGPGLSAPVKLFFSVGNRSAAIRIPGYSMSPREQRIEYRMADAIGSPYLTMAAICAAMADGIESRIQPDEHGFGPYDVNVYELPSEERAKMSDVPTSLEAALANLRSDSDFLTKGGVFDMDFVDMWIGTKTQNEVSQLAMRPHPYEFTLYYDR
jgi:glutamine synthetase